MRTSILNRLSVQTAMFHDSYQVTNDSIEVLTNWMPEVSEKLQKFKGLTLGICYRGEARLSVNTDEHVISGGKMFISLPIDIFRIEEMSVDFLASVILVPESLLQQLNIQMHKIHKIIPTIRTNNNYKLSEMDIREIDTYFKLMQFNVSISDEYQKETLSNLFVSLLYKLGGIFNRQKQEQKPSVDLISRKNHHLREFLMLLSDHFKEHRSISFYAEKLCVTPKHLSCIVKEISGRTATEWINEYVLREAKTLLKHTDQNIQEIAYHLNFTSQSFFGKYFKRLVGLSPNQFRHMSIN